MSRKILLDTSFIVAFLFEKDKYHPQAVEIIRHLPDDTDFYLHSLVFQETATVICRRCKERNIDCNWALDIFASFVTELNLIESPLKLFDTLEKMKNYDCKLSFVDIKLLELAISTNFEILTFDANLKNCEKTLRKN